MHIANYVEKINKFILSERTVKLRIAFDFYDQNNDGKVCLVDLFRNFKGLSEQDYFIKNDIILMS